jgi:hypothetical protein
MGDAYDDASLGTTESEGEYDDNDDIKKGSKKGGGGGGHESDSAEDYTDDEDEGEDGYKPGGYHPVCIGEVYNQRCVCVITSYFQCGDLFFFFVVHERCV